ncbi:MAG: hypothetical protein ACOX0X_00640 [Candidatus Dojkabacteria bacterium]
MGTVLLSRVLKFISALLLFSFSIFFVLASFSYIFSFSAISESKKLGWGTVSNFGDKSTSESFYIVDTGGQLGTDIYTSENYRIMSGFGYFYSLIPFSFTIDSPVSFNFAELTKDTPQMAYTDLVVSSGAAHGYVVVVSQDKQLENVDIPGRYIEDTLGDNQDITHTNAGIWELNTTYGFGYRMSNLQGTDATFTTGYKQFADLSNSEVAQVVMQNSGVTRTSSTRLYYKVNVGSAQDSGFYRNSIFFKCTGTF